MIALEPLTNGQWAMAYKFVQKRFGWSDEKMRTHLEWIGKD